MSALTQSSAGEAVASPLTGTGQVRLAAVFSCEEIIRTWRRRYGQDIAAELHGLQEVRLYRCNESGLGFFVPATAAGSGALYGQLSQFAWYYLPAKWEHAMALHDLAGARRVLEVGCGRGAFVARLRKAGVDATGLELSASAVAEAQARGVPVLRQDLFECSPEWHGSFDAVCSFQVLEHVPEPLRFLAASVKLLRPGGKLIACVPNDDSFLQYEYNVLNMPPHHLSLWRSETFRFLERVLPVRLLHLRVEPLQSLHAGSYANAQFRRLGAAHPNLRWLSNPLTRVCARCGLRGLVWLGAGRWFTGQCLYAAFEKKAP